MPGKDAYGSIAKFYDSFMSRPMRDIRRSVATLMPAAGRVIDIGCGTGEQSLLLAQNGRHITGIDSSPAMLAQAEARRTTNTEFILGDGRNVPRPDGYFAVAVLSFILHETGPETRIELIAEAKRLVGTNGSIIIAEYEPGKGFRAGILALGIRFIEYLAGREHYRGYRDWMKHGGLSGFWKKQGLHIEKTRRHFAGNILVAVSHNVGR